MNIADTIQLIESNDLASLAMFLFLMFWSTEKIMNMFWWSFTEIVKLVFSCFDKRKSKNEFNSSEEEIK